MPSWKPDCLKASVKLAHLGNTLNSMRQFSGKIYVGLN